VDIDEKMATHEGNPNSDTSGATARSQGAPQTRVFFSKKYGFSVEKIRDDKYFLRSTLGLWEDDEYGIHVVIYSLFGVDEAKAFDRWVSEA